MKTQLPRIAAIGAGRMGRGIAHVFAYAGFEVDLIDLKHGEAFSCRVVWRKYPMIGVTFDARDPLETAESPRLRSLKSLWLAAVNRG